MAQSNHLSPQVMSVRNQGSPEETAGAGHQQHNVASRREVADGVACIINRPARVSWSHDD